MNNFLQKNPSAIILAAGLSSRMKDFKPLLPFGKTTMIETIINLFKKNNIKDIIVVTGHNSSLIKPLIEKSGGRPVFNKNFKSGMMSSIQTGIRNIQKDNPGFFLMPGDIPAVRPSTIDLMIHEFHNSTNNIILPCFDGKPGHPPLIPSYIGNDILDLKNGSTLRHVLFSDKLSTIKLKVHDQGILMDADDKKQYEKVCQKFKNQYIPDKEECLSIIDETLPQHDNIRIHMANVSLTALKIANAVPSELNTDLVIASALLHDIKRKKKNHAVAGAQFMKEMGFLEVSEIIAQHMDIDVDPAIDIKEKEIVYFADKICNGHNNSHGIDLNYHMRFANSIMKSPWAVSSISKRYEDTQLIQARIEKSAARSIREILSN